MNNPVHFMSYVRGGVLVILAVIACGTTTVRAEDQEVKQDAELLVVPIPRITPSWQLSYRPSEQNGYQGQYFFITMPAIGAGLRYEYNDETRETNGEKSTESYHRFSERVGFRSRGWVYHPTLLTFRATLEPELSQMQEKNAEGETASSNLFSPDYLLDLTFLDPKPYTLNLHAKRRELPSWSAFKGGFETLIYDFGGNVQLDISRMFRLADFYRTSFGYNHIDSSVDGFYLQDEISDNFFFNAMQQGGRLKTQLQANYWDSERTTDDYIRNTKTLDVNWTNKYLFRDVNRIALDGIWTYRRQELDTIELQTFRLNEHLNWRHRRNLTSFYKFIYSYSDSNGENPSNSVNLEGRLEHLLFENLTTSAGLETLYSTDSGGQQTAADPYLSLLYTRRLPFGSINLRSNWDYRWTMRDYDNARSRIQVNGEPHILRFTQDIYLDNYNVVADSIIVTNTSGNIQYIEGIDYQVDVLGDYVVIRSLSLGDIENGQDVLVNYTYQQDLAYDDGLFTQRYGMGFTLFRDTTLQLSHARSQQYILSGNPPLVRADDVVSTASLQHRIGRWSITRLDVSDYDRASEVNSQRWQASQKITIHPLRRVSMTFGGAYGQRMYAEPDQEEGVYYDTDFYGGSVNVGWGISDNLAFNLEGFSNVSDSEIENSVNTGVRASLVYKYRIWTARLSYELSEQSTDDLVRETSRIRNYVRCDLVRVYW